MHFWLNILNQNFLETERDDINIAYIASLGIGKDAITKLTNAKGERYTSVEDFVQQTRESGGNIDEVLLEAGLIKDKVDAVNASDEEMSKVNTAVVAGLSDEQFKQTYRDLNLAGSASIENLKRDYITQEVERQQDADYIEFMVAEFTTNANDPEVKKAKAKVGEATIKNAMAAFGFKQQDIKNLSNEDIAFILTGKTGVEAQNWIKENSDESGNLNADVFAEAADPSKMRSVARNITLLKAYNDRQQSLPAGQRGQSLQNFVASKISDGFLYLMKTLTNLLIQCMLQKVAFQLMIKFVQPLKQHKLLLYEKKQKLAILVKKQQTILWFNNFLDYHQMLKKLKENLLLLD